MYQVKQLENWFLSFYLGGQKALIQNRPEFPEEKQGLSLSHLVQTRFMSREPPMSFKGESFSSPGSQKPATSLLILWTHGILCQVSDMVKSMAPSLPQEYLRAWEKQETPLHPGNGRLLFSSTPSPFWGLPGTSHLVTTDLRFWRILLLLFHPLVGQGQQRQSAELSCRDPSTPKLLPALQSSFSFIFKCASRNNIDHLVGETERFSSFLTATCHHLLPPRHWSA